jgi:translin
VLATIDQHLQQREHRRAELYQRARRLRRLSQGTMGKLHEGHDVADAIAEIRREMSELSAWLRKDGRGDEGLAHDALQESVEAVLLDAIVRHRPLPGPAELDVDPEPYLMGLGDVAGEVRRLALDRLAAGDLSGAEAHLATMDHVYRSLLRFDTTRAIVALKPKQDVARSLLERTRGDVTMAKVLGRSHRPPEAGA